MTRRLTPTAQQIAPYNLEHTNRDAWLALRREGIGGSDVAAILGLDSYSTAWQIWLDKTQAFGDLPDDTTEKQAERMRWGHRAERGAADEFTLRHPGVKLTRIGMIAHTGHPWMRVSLDWRITGCEHGSPCLGEVKNRIQFAAKDWDTAGDPDKVPDAPAVQVQWALGITGYTHGHLLAVIGGGEMREYIIQADPQLQATLKEECSWFWHQHVLTNVAPPIDGTERTGRVLAHLWDADPEKIITATPSIMQTAKELQAAKDDVKDAGKEASRLAHVLEAELGDAEAALHPDTGKPVVSWKQNGTFNGAQWRAGATPGMAEACSLLTTKPDTKLLAELDPDSYRKHRARVLRLHGALED